MDLSKSTVLVTGGSGLLGSKLVGELSGKCRVFASYNIHPWAYCDFPLDVTNRVDVQHLINKISPDVIVHTAALTGVDYCESNKREAWAVNVEGTRNIVEAGKTVGSRIVYISTDYVFDGGKGAYTEDDHPNPLDYYGETKLEGERVVQELDDYVIARTSVLYGWHSRPNFVTWAIGELKQGRRINIVRDQFNSPTLADDLAEVVLNLIETGEAGVFHVSGSERISRYDFTKKIAEVFELDETLINPVTSDELDWIAERPLDSSLDVSKVSGIRSPLGVVAGLRRMRGK